MTWQAEEHWLFGGDVCDFNERGICRECGVSDDHCSECGGRGYHREGCLAAASPRDHVCDEDCPRMTLWKAGSQYGPIGLYRCSCDSHDYVLSDHDIWIHADACLACRLEVSAS